MSEVSWLNFLNKTSASEQKNGKQWDWGEKSFLIYCLPWERDGIIEEGRGQGVTKRGRLYWLTNSDLHYEPKCRVGVAGLSQWVQLYTGANISFADPYLTYGRGLEANANAIVVSVRYQKYQNGAASNQLTDECKGVWWRVDSESVDVWQRGVTVLCVRHSLMLSIHKSHI